MNSEDYAICIKCTTRKCYVQLRTLLTLRDIGDSTLKKHWTVNILRMIEWGHVEGKSFYRYTFLEKIRCNAPVDKLALVSMEDWLEL